MVGWDLSQTSMQSVVQAGCDATVNCARAFQFLCHRLQRGCVVKSGPFGCLPDDDGTILEITVSYLPGGDVGLEALTPGLEVIDPGSHRVLMGAEGVYLEFGAPAIVTDLSHANFLPRASRVRGVSWYWSMSEDCRDRVVRIGEDVGRDRDVVALDSFNGVAAVVDLWFDGLDDDP